MVGIRPEHLEDASIAHEDSSDRRLTGQVELREALGSELMVHVAIEVPPALTEEVQEFAEDAGTTAEDLQGGDRHAQSSSADSTRTRRCRRGKM